MIQINKNIQISENEINFKFIRASGPGGQNVNKVSTAVQLKFDINSSPNLTDEIKKRLIKLGGNKITPDGIIIIEAKRFRSQEKNKEDALNRLKNLIERASIVKRRRFKTKPSAASNEERIRKKKKKSDTKKSRSSFREKFDY